MDLSLDASVEFLYDNLKQLLVYHVTLIADAENEINKLIHELGHILAILKDASQKYKKDEIYKQWERRIREMLYDIEDTVYTCMTNMVAASGKPWKRNYCMRLFKTPPMVLSEAVKALRINKVLPIRKVDFKNFTIANNTIEDEPDPTVADEPDPTVVEARETRPKKTQNIVGLEGKAEELINFLNSESSKLEIASIVGMSGLGKTTLSWKIFEDPRIKYEFPVRIWLNVLDDVNMKIILLTILRKFTTEIPDEPVEELLTKVRNYLTDEKFLIVMDGVWTLNAWEKVKEVLPFENNMGRVLVTTRHWDVAERSSNRRPHYLRFLTGSESWKLLQYEVYGMLNLVSQDLEVVGQVIANDCSGLPLSLVLIGGILVEKNLRAGGNILAIKEEWEKVSTNVKPFLVDGDKKKLLSSIISLSYEKLRYQLRNCFLYLGVFPKGADISVKELLRLWIAEGFIESRGRSFELIALENLKELINRNLVMVKEKNFDGEPKVCQIHDSVREICTSKANFENLNLFQEITSYGNGFEPLDNIGNFRRICIHSHVLDFMKKTRKVPKARSFLSFDQTTKILKPADMACVTDAFGLLRVYNAKNLKFPKFPQKLVQLLHLRYLTLVVEHCTSLPEAIYELWNLQTLILDVANTLDIKDDIWKMRQLRHILTKASTTLSVDGGCDYGGDNLQTLSRLSPESCTSNVFGKARNLITLGIQGDLNKLVSSECLSILDSLQKLKLVHKVSNGLTRENPLPRLPDLQNFPPNLKVLVLVGTNMDWKRVSTLSVLEFLKELKLKENAFVGSSWEAESIFHRLEQLHIETSTELVFWKARGNPFPELKFLSLNNCVKLVEIPSAICKSLEKIHIERVTKILASSAEAIARDKNKQNIAFKLDIG